MKSNIKTQNDSITVKTSIFDIPSQVWKSGFDSFFLQSKDGDQTIKFASYASQKENIDFVRDFNLMCAQ